MRAGFYRNRSFLSMPFSTFLQTKSPAIFYSPAPGTATLVVFIPTNSGFFQSSISKGQLPTFCLGRIILDETSLFVKGEFGLFSSNLQALHFSRCCSIAQMPIIGISKIKSRAFFDKFSLS